MRLIEVLFLTFVLITLSVSQCPDSWVPSAAVPNKCYLIATTKNNWFNAGLYCRNAAIGSHLTSINSAFENSNIDADIMSIPEAASCDQMWIGGSDFDEVGQFTWADGSRFQYTNWAIGQPNLINQCVALQMQTRFWTTSACSNQSCFVCEYTNPSSSTTAPPLTTTSVASTPPNSCANKICNETVGYPGTCIYTNGIATCVCPGNLDRNGCGTVSCVAPASGGAEVTRAGPFWSPGFNGTSGTYRAGTCQWRITAPFGMTINLTATHFKLESQARLSILTDEGTGRTLSGDYSAYLNILNQRLRDTLYNAAVAALTFSSSTAGPAQDYYFSFQLNFIPPS